ncbi:LysM peptidoglycan-binding domain-containing protein [Ramlibacter sp. PS3R-8]|uniref:LysM peptidoglycan-binding domain-containing protein n=1 Tax=Ramlibacter sp. PS3R-8 TaxID=3133437 RepID=UPI0030B02C8C
MVAIVSGNSLGLDLTSLRTLGPQEFTGKALHGRAQGTYVNAANGNLVVQAEDGFAVGGGPDVQALRTYNSQGLLNDDNGDNWNSGVYLQPLQVVGVLNAAGSTIARTGRDGAVAIYTFDSDTQKYVTTQGDGAHDTITYVAGASRMEWSDGSTGLTQTYEASGAFRLLFETNADGEKLTYGYTGVRLDSVLTEAGEGTRYVYETDLPRADLKEVRTLAAGGICTGSVRYGYDLEHRLISVTVDHSPGDENVDDGDRYKMTYTYEAPGSHRVATVTEPGGITLTFTYLNGRVSTVTDALDHTTTFTYGSGYTNVRDARGGLTRFEYDGAGQLTRITAPATGSSTQSRQFSYVDGNVVSITDGLGNRTVCEYDVHGNQTLQRDAAGNTVRRFYDSNNQLLTETVYLQPDPDGDAALAAAGPRTTRYVYDTTGKNHLRFIISAEGRVTEHRYDPNTWDLLRTLQYEAGVYSTDGLLPRDTPTLDAMQDWAAGQAGAHTKLVDFAYDFRGQLKTRTSYAKVTASGAGVIDGSQSVQTFVYSQQGRLLKTVTPKLGVSIFTYDGLGRVETASDASGRVTVTDYQDASRKIKVTLANGLVSTSSYDVANRLEWLRESAPSASNLGETQYFYDENDRLRMTQDPVGVRHWWLYDDAGRRTAEIDGNGTMTEWGYDAAGRLTTSVTYGSAVDVSLLSDASGKPLIALKAADVRPPQPDAYDNRSWFAYDAAGRLVRTATRTGSSVAVTETQYDGASRVVRIVQFATLLAYDAASFAPGLVTAPGLNPDDRVTRYFYDGDGLRRGQLDAEGYLSAFNYDQAGQLVERISYARATYVPLREQGTLAQLTPAATDVENDIRTVYFYDKQGRLVGELDGENYLTETVYDIDGNAERTVRYARKVVGIVTAGSDLVRPVLDDANDRTTVREFDILGRISTETNPEGIKTGYTYDLAGNVVTTVRALGIPAALSSYARYDVQGRVIAELGGEGAARLTDDMTQAQIDAVWSAYGTTHAYDAAGRRLSSTGPLGWRELYFYDSDDALVYTVNALGEVRQMEYDVHGRLSREVMHSQRISVTGLVGGAVPAVLLTRLASATEADGETRYGYTRDGKLASVTNARGSQTTYGYNAFGDRIASFEPAAGSATLETRFTVDHRGLVTKTQLDPDGLNIRSYVIYDAFARAEKTTDALGAITLRGFDRLGRTDETTDALKGVWRTTYDAFNGILTSANPLGQKTTFTYDRTGNVLTATDPRGTVTQRTYDPLGRQKLERIDPDGLDLQRSRTYDADGNVTSSTDGAGNTTRQVYDALGRLVFDIDPAGGVARISYDAAGRVVRTMRYGIAISLAGLAKAVTADQIEGRLTADAAVDPVEHRVYDTDGRLLATVDSTGALVRYKLDLAGNIIQRTAFARAVDLGTWVPGTLPSVVPDPLRDQVVSMVYDEAGRLAFQVDGVGAVTEQVYDRLGQVVRTISYANPLATLPALGAATSLAAMRTAVTTLAAAATDRSMRFGYDAMGRQVLAIDGTGAATETEYDAVGNVKAVIRRSKVVSLSALSPAAGFAELSGKVAMSADDQRTQYAYDAARRLVSCADALGGTENYGYDAAGNKTSFSNKKGDTWLYEYDAAGRMTKETSPVLALSAMPASSGMDITTGPESVITRLGYDGASNLIFRTEAHGRPEQRTTKYEYDAAGRQVLVTFEQANVYEAETDPLDTTALAARNDTPRTLQTRTIYDALGNAVANIDVGGALSQKTYDAAGRVLYEVDAVGYVTGYQRNTFGQVTVLTRYAKGTALEARAVTRASQAVTTKDVETAVMATGVDHSDDRTLTSTYDRAGRLTRVQEKSADTFDPTAAAGLQWRSARKTTDTSYNAFGEAVEVKSFRNVAADDGSVVTRFYDGNGREKASIDATGYVTERTYDAFGNLVSLKEYANAVVAGWNRDVYTRGVANANDRKTEYEYDQGNRKVLERRRAVEYSVASDGTSVVGDLVTKFEFDAVGNPIAVIDADDRRTRTYYDALGRISAVLQPQTGILTPAGGDEPVAVNPLTTFLRDAHGNVLREKRHANGGAAGAAGYTEGAAHITDRIVRTRYDRLGRAVQVTDARGNQQFFSYDAYGKVAKKWQPLEDGTGRVTYEVNTYDSLGQLVSVRRPGTTMEVQGGITARWITPPPGSPLAPPPPGGQLDLGWTGLEGARVRVEVTYTTPLYTVASSPNAITFPTRTVTVTQEKLAAQAPAGLTVVFQDPVAKINTIRVWELNGTTWDIRWEGSYAKAQGTGVTEVDQSTVDEKVETLRYNAFGEVVSRSAEGGAEYFHYDAAGRLWRTNSGDGVDKIFLYDAQGNRTSEIRSPGDARGNVDLRLVGSAEEAHLDIRNRRTDFTYDAAGRLVQKTDAARLDTQGGLSVRQMVATSTVQAAAQPVYVDGYSGGQWAEGTATVKLTWTNLAVLGSGDVKFRVSYQTASTSELGAGGAAVIDSEVFASHEAAQGATLSWTTKPIASITEITVWKKDSNGTWTQVIKQAPGTSTYQIDLDAANNRWAAEFLRYRPSGSTGAFTPATLTDFGDRAVWNALAGLAAGSYEYELGIAPQGQAERQVGTGTFTVAANRVVTVQPADNAGSAWQRPVVNQKMDRWGNVVELSDARSADWKTVYAYNANNQMVMQRLPTAGGLQASSNPTTRIYYDALGRQVAVRDALGNVNGTGYGPTGNLVRENHADTGVVTHRYNAFGEKVATTDARGNVQSFTYDQGGNLVAVKKGTAPVFDVDVNQQLLEPETRAIEERWTYDALGRRLSHFNGENEKTTFRYDLLGNVIEVVQPMGQRTYAAYDAQGHKIAEVDANGYEATWSYDYFGKLLAHTDIGGAKYQYTYDNARQLLKQTNSRGQQLAYKYDAAGQVTEIRDTQSGYAVKVTTYAYDLSGRRLLEKTVSGAEVHQDNRLAYDAQGKLRDVADTRVRMQLAYDANGNRTSVSTTVRYAGLNGEVLHKTSRFFQYDVMNRQTLVDAVDAAGAKDKSTHELTYDKNGNRTSDSYLAYAVVRNAAGAWTVREVLGAVTETYAYDNLNRLVQVKRDDMVIDKRSYDAADRVLGSGGNLTTAYLTQMNRLVELGEVGRPDIRINRYDANGRMLHQSVKRADGIALQEISWDPTRVLGEATGPAADAFRAEGYDHAGNVKGYAVFTHEGSKTVKYSTTLARFEGYVGTRSTVTASGSGDMGMNVQVYDANGHLARVDDAEQSGNGRSFVNDAQGRALSTVRGGHVQRQLIVNGEVMGRYGVGVHDLVPTDSDGNTNFTDVADFNFSFAAVSPTNPAPAPGVYIVQLGDTLQTIASGAYGDGALWYRIAQANGLSSNDDVRVGQVLNIPNRVGTIHNNDVTFKPYDPSKITGDLAPSLPLPGQEGCGAAGQVLMLIVAIVVTIYTAGAATAGVSAGFTSTMATGAGVMTGSVAAGSLGTAGTLALAGGMGAAAGQMVGLATGTIEKFDFKAIALAAIGGAIGGSLQGMNFVGNQAIDGIARAVAGNVLTQGVATATGLQSSFSWKSVAGATVGSAVGQAVTPIAGYVFDSSPFMASLTAGLAAGAATALARGGKVAVLQVAVDAFGNALGQSLAENVNGASGSVAPGNGSQMDHETVGWLRQELGMPDSGNRYAGVNLAAADMVGGVMYDNGRSAAGPHIDLPQVDLFVPTLPVVTVTASSELMTQEDFRRFEIERMNAAGAGFIADDLPGASGGSITAVQPSFWERMWGAPAVQQVMGNTITGKVVGGMANFIGTGVSAFRADGYNPATLKHVYGVNKQRALQDTVIGLATLPIGGGGSALARAEIAGMKSTVQAEISGTRAALQAQTQQPFLLTYTPTTNTLNQIRRMPFPERWQAGEKYAQELYGSAGQKHFPVPAADVAGGEILGTGGRFVDVPVPTANGGTFAGEVKLYQPWRTVNGQPVQQFVPLTEQMQQQVLKDAWLRNNVPGYDPRWIFLDAPPSVDLSRYLMQHRIDHVIHH